MEYAVDIQMVLFKSIANGHYSYSYRYYVLTLIIISVNNISKTISSKFDFHSSASKNKMQNKERLTNWCLFRFANTLSLMNRKSYEMKCTHKIQYYTFSTVCTKAFVGGLNK